MTSDHVYYSLGLNLGRIAWVMDYEPCRCDPELALTEQLEYFNLLMHGLNI